MHVFGTLTVQCSESVSQSHSSSLLLLLLLHGTHAAAAAAAPMPCELRCGTLPTFQVRKQEGRQKQN